jgi:WD40 repeat protein
LLLLLPAILTAADPLPPGAVARLGATRFRHYGATSALAISPDGKTLAVRDYWALYLFEAATGREITRIGDGMPLLQGTAVAYSPDGRILAYEGERETVVFWDSATRKPLRILHRTGGWQQEGTLNFSPDGKVLAVMDGGTNVSLFETATGKLLRTLNEPRAAITSNLTFSPDDSTPPAKHVRECVPAETSRG